MKKLVEKIVPIHDKTDLNKLMKEFGVKPWERKPEPNAPEIVRVRTVYTVEVILDEISGDGRPKYQMILRADTEGIAEAVRAHLAEKLVLDPCLA